MSYPDQAGPHLKLTEMPLVAQNYFLSLELLLVMLKDEF